MENQTSFEDRLRNLNASLPSGFKTSEERMDDLNSGLNQLGLSLYEQKPAYSRFIEDSIPKNEDEQVADIMAQAKDEVNGGVSPQSALKWIYLFATFLCIFMMGWILVFPSSWLMGHSETHDAWIHKKLVEPYDGTQIHPKIFTKYAGHSDVQFTHTLPAAVWSAAIPFQLHQGFRKTYKTSHRRIGYAFLCSSLLMTVGMFLIVIKKLTFDYDYEGLAPPLSKFEEIQTKCSVLGMGVWFAFTSSMAVMEARKKRFQSHKHYIYRHIGSGLWVAIQRLLIAAFGPQKNPEAMRDRFGDAASIAVVAAFALGELAVYLDRQPSGKQIKTQ